MKYEVFLRTDRKLESFYQKAIAEYEKRLGPYCRISWKPVKKEKDWIRLMEPEPGRKAFLVRADRTAVSSENLSRMMEDWEKSGVKKISFFVDQSDAPAGDLPVFPLSEFSMPAGMTGMILYEQIYRGYRILHHQPYHK